MRRNTRLQEFFCSCLTSMTETPPWIATLSWRRDLCVLVTLGAKYCIYKFPLIGLPEQICSTWRARLGATHYDLMEKKKLWTIVDWQDWDYFCPTLELDLGEGLIRKRLVKCGQVCHMFWNFRQREGLNCQLITTASCVELESTGGSGQDRTGAPEQIMKVRWAHLTEARLMGSSTPTSFTAFRGSLGTSDWMSIGRLFASSIRIFFFTEWKKEEFGENMEQDFLSALKPFYQTIRRLRRREEVSWSMPGY